MEINNLYIVQTRLSSSNRILYSSEISDQVQEITFKFTKDVRRKISAIRGRFLSPIYHETADVYGLRICREGQRGKIIDNINIANRQFKGIDPTLGAEVIFIPLDLNQVAWGGELYEQFRLAIKGQIYKEVMDRVKKIATRPGALPTRSKNSLLKILDRMDTINVIDDQEITDQIKLIREMVEKELLFPLQEQLEKDMFTLTNRGANLEL